MEKVREIPEGEFTRQIYRENAYILFSLLCALSDSFNLSAKSKKLFRNMLKELSKEIGEEDIVIHME